MQIKTRKRYHFISSRTAIVKMTMCRNCKSHTLLWECTIVEMPWKIFWQFLKRLDRELPYDPVILLLGIHTQKMKTYVYIKTYA